MLLDARFFEKYLKVNKLTAKESFRDVSFNDDGSVSLRLMAAQQYSGIARLQFDAQDNQMILSGSLSKITSFDPYRFREGEAFRAQTHLTLAKPLPKGVTMSALPCSTLLALGVFVSGVYETNFTGVIEVTLFTFRRIEISYGFVVANLQFRDCEGAEGGQRGKSNDSKSKVVHRSKK